MFSTAATSIHAALDETEGAFGKREVLVPGVTPIGILRFDTKGRCRYANEGWCMIAGLTSAEVIGDGWLNAIHPEDRAAVQQRWAEMRRRGEFSREEIRFQHRDGSLRWVIAEGAELRDESRKLLGYIRAATDITRHRQIEAELAATRDSLEKRVQERTAELHLERSERQRLEMEILATKDEERRRFSQDLHDGLGQLLTGTLFHALALERDLATQASPHAERLSKLVELMNAALNATHDVARGVDPVSPCREGLATALQALAASLNDDRVMRCIFACDEPVLIYDRARATHLFRLAQQAATNAIKHSHGSRIMIRLQNCSTYGMLTIEDDGDGLPDPPTRGRGLDLIEYRARLIGGELEIKGAPGCGTSIQCRFSLDEATDSITR
jgi:PAS domain S-box-containing protein